MPMRLPKLPQPLTGREGRREREEEAREPPPPLPFLFLSSSGSGFPPPLLLCVHGFTCEGGGRKYRYRMHEGRKVARRQRGAAATTLHTGDIFHLSFSLPRAPLAM